MEFKVEIYKFLICYAVEVILDIYSVAIYVNLVISFQKKYVFMFIFFLDFLESS